MFYFLEKKTGNDFLSLPHDTSVIFYYFFLGGGTTAGIF